MERRSLKLVGLRIRVGRLFRYSVLVRILSFWRSRSDRCTTLFVSFVVSSRNG